MNMLTLIEHICCPFGYDKSILTLLDHFLIFFGLSLVRGLMGNRLRPYLLEPNMLIVQYYFRA